MHPQPDEVNVMTFARPAILELRGNARATGEVRPGTFGAYRTSIADPTDFHMHELAAATSGPRISRSNGTMYSEHTSKASTVPGGSRSAKAPEAPSPNEPNEPGPDSISPAPGLLPANQSVLPRNVLFLRSA